MPRPEDINALRGAIRIGTAGWSIPKSHAAGFPGSGTHLQRYASQMNAVEINSSFYRPHLPETYARWADSVPPGFRFAVKLPRAITHERRLAAADEALDRFMKEISGLAEKRGPSLVQLPPGLAFSAVLAGRFFETLRARDNGPVVCEPRHATWFTPEADALLVDYQIARVAADPAPVPQATLLGGWCGLTYLRLHGSPRMYYSAYAPAFLDRIAEILRAPAAQAEPRWCIFDNTALGSAMQDALSLRQRLTPRHV